jgi:hypothetical protein
MAPVGEGGVSFYFEWALAIGSKIAGLGMR